MCPPTDSSWGGQSEYELVSSCEGALESLSPAQKAVALQARANIAARGAGEHEQDAVEAEVARKLLRSGGSTVSSREMAEHAASASSLAILELKLAGPTSAPTSPSATTADVTKLASAASTIDLVPARGAQPVPLLEAIASALGDPKYGSSELERLVAAVVTSVVHDESGVDGEAVPGVTWRELARGSSGGSGVAESEQLRFLVSSPWVAIAALSIALDRSIAVCSADPPIAARFRKCANSSSSGGASSAPSSSCAADDSLRLGLCQGGAFVPLVYAPLPLEETQALIAAALARGNSVPLDSTPAVMLIGTTGAGKSTTTNALAGKPLQQQKNKEGVVEWRVEREDTIPGSEIGVTGSSCTDLVNPVTIQIDDERLRRVAKKVPAITVLDPPGFADTTGPKTDLANIVGTTHILRKAKSLKVPVVLERSMLSRTGHLRLGPYKLLTRSVSRLYKNLDGVDKHTLLWISKAEPSFDERTLLSSLEAIKSDLKAEQARGINTSKELAVTEIFLDLVEFNKYHIIRLENGEDERNALLKQLVMNDSEFMDSSEIRENCQLALTEESIALLRGEVQSASEACRRAIDAKNFTSAARKLDTLRGVVDQLRAGGGEALRIAENGYLRTKRECVEVVQDVEHNAVRHIASVLTVTSDADPLTEESLIDLESARDSVREAVVLREHSDNGAYELPNEQEMLRKVHELCANLCDDALALDLSADAKLLGAALRLKRLSELYYTAPEFRATYARLCTGVRAKLEVAATAVKSLAVEGKHEQLWRALHSLRNTDRAFAAILEPTGSPYYTHSVELVRGHLRSLSGEAVALINGESDVSKLLAHVSPVLNELAAVKKHIMLCEHLGEVTIDCLDHVVSALAERHSAIVDTVLQANEANPVGFCDQHRPVVELSTIHAIHPDVITLTAQRHEKVLWDIRGRCSRYTELGKDAIINMSTANADGSELFDKAQEYIQNLRRASWFDRLLDNDAKDGAVGYVASALAEMEHSLEERAKRLLREVQTQLRTPLSSSTSFLPLLEAFRAISQMEPLHNTMPGVLQAHNEACRLLDNRVSADSGYVNDLLTTGGIFDKNAFEAFDGHLCMGEQLKELRLPRLDHSRTEVIGKLVADICARENAVREKLCKPLHRGEPVSSEDMYEVGQTLRIVMQFESYPHIAATLKGCVEMNMARMTRILENELRHLELEFDDEYDLEQQKNIVKNLRSAQENMPDLLKAHFIEKHGIFRDRFKANNLEERNELHLLLRDRQFGKRLLGMLQTQAALEGQRQKRDMQNIRSWMSSTVKSLFDEARSLTLRLNSSGSQPDLAAFRVVLEKLSSVKMFQEYLLVEEVDYEVEYSLLSQTFQKQMEMPAQRCAALCADQRFADAEETIKDVGRVITSIPIGEFVEIAIAARDAALDRRKEALARFGDYKSFQASVRSLKQLHAAMTIPKDDAEATSQYEAAYQCTVDVLLREVNALLSRAGGSAVDTMATTPLSCSSVVSDDSSGPFGTPHGTPRTGLGAAEAKRLQRDLTALENHVIAHFAEQQNLPRLADELGGLEMRVAEAREALERAEKAFVEENNDMLRDADLDAKHKWLQQLQAQPGKFDEYLGFLNVLKADFRAHALNVRATLDDRSFDGNFVSRFNELRKFDFLSNFGVTNVKSTIEDLELQVKRILVEFLAFVERHHQRIHNVEYIRNVCLKTVDCACLIDIVRGSDQTEASNAASIIVKKFCDTLKPIMDTLDNADSSIEMRQEAISRLKVYHKSGVLPLLPRIDDLQGGSSIANHNGGHLKSLVANLSTPQEHEEMLAKKTSEMINRGKEMVLRDWITVCADVAANRTNVDDVALDMTVLKTIFNLAETPPAQGGPLVAQAQDACSKIVTAIAQASELFSKEFSGSLARGNFKTANAALRTFSGFEDAFTLASADLHNSPRPQSLLKELSKHIDEYKTLVCGAIQTGMHTSKEVLEPLLHLAFIGESIPDGHHEVYVATDAILRAVKNKWHAIGLNQLGNFLKDSGDRRALEIVHEHGKELFVRLQLENFNRVIKLDKQDAIHKIVGKPEMSREDYDRLTRYVDKYELEYNDLVHKHITVSADETNLLTIAAQAKSLIEPPTSNPFAWFASLFVKRELADVIPKLLALVFAYWSLDFFLEHKDELDTKGGNELAIMQPHTVQVVCILRLLGSHGSGKIAKNHLAQVPTGEGKSVILSVTAVVLALCNFDVDIACYSATLSKRDREAFSRLFDGFRVQHRIRHGTFEQLADRLIKSVHGDVRELTSAHLKGDSLPGPPQRQARSSAVLLIDEVDAFLDPTFIGKEYRPSCALHDPTIGALMRHIWASPELSVEELCDSDEYQAVLAANIVDAEHEWFVRDAVARMQASAASFRDSPKEHVLRDGKIGYKHCDSVSFEKNLGYTTNAAYIYEYERGELTEQDMLNNLPFFITSAEFAYAAIPSRQYYDCILGVTGTLDTLPESDLRILQEQYKIEQHTYLPTMFGDRSDNFRPGSDVGVVYNEADHHIAVGQEVQERIKASGEASAPDGQRAVLVFFPDMSSLQDFARSSVCSELRRHYRVNILTEHTRLTDALAFIKRATSEGQITLLTPSFGRGTDFALLDEGVKKNGGVHVMMTFFPLEKAEEVQIRGRQGRQGEKGSVSMRLCMPQLEALNVREEDVRSWAESKGLYKNLDRARSDMVEQNKKEQIKALGSSVEKHKAVAEALDSRSPERIDSLLMRLNKTLRTESINVIIALDVTCSMHHLLKQVKQTLNEMFTRVAAVLDENNITRGFQLQICGYSNYNAPHNQLLRVSSFEAQPEALTSTLDGWKTGGGWGNEAIEAVLFHANRLNQSQDIDQVILIGDAGANTADEVVEKRQRSHIGGWDTAELAWNPGQSGFPVTDALTEAECLKRRDGSRVPINAFYIDDRAQASFEELARITGGSAERLDIFSSTGAEALMAAVCVNILCAVGGVALADAYRANFGAAADDE